MNERPLSPHLQVYRLPLTAVVSITHRATGVFLSLGMIPFVLFLMSVSGGAKYFASAQALLQFLPVQLCLWAWIYSLLFHLCHGIRHLIWDTGHSFDRETLNRYAIYELVSSASLAVLVFILSLNNLKF